ncbi:MAG: hypothetical protein Kow00109_20160 [Acidobacteriota bacterium]
MNPGHSVAMALRRAYRSLHRRTNQVLQRTGYTADQFVILSLLWEQDGVSQNDLVQRATSDPNTIRAILVLLEKKGLVQRRRDPKDARIRRVYLTDEGRRVYDALTVEIRPLHDLLRSAFDPEERNLLRQLLDKFADLFNGGDVSPAAPPDSSRDAHSVMPAPPASPLSGGGS